MYMIRSLKHIDMYKKYLNIDTIESHILLQIDEDFQLDIKHGSYCAWIAFPTKKGKLKQQYAILTDDDLLLVAGKHEEMMGKLQAKLGKTKEELHKLISGL